MLASSRKPCGGGRPQAAGENARPTLRPGTGGDTKAAALCQARRRAGASIGLCAGGGDHAVGAAQQRRHRPLRRGRAAAPGAVARIRYIVGRAFTPAGEGCRGVTLWFCVSAAPQGRGGVRQTGRVLARSCAAPLSRLMPTAPLTGEPFGWKPFAKPPLQGEVDAPKGADGGVYCRLAVKMARQSLALCFVGDNLRAKSRHFVLCAPKRHLRAAVLASSRKPCGGAGPKRRAKTPALQSRRERATTDKSQPSARPVGGPVQASALTQGGDHAVGAAQQRRHRPLRRGAAAPGAVARIRYIVGRAFTPAGEVCGGVILWFCVSAASQGWGGLRQPGRVLAGSCAAPLSRLTPTAPLAGEPSGRRLPKASPARGGGCAERRRRRGALPVGGGDILQNSAGHCPASAGDDAGIIPEPCGGGRPQAAGENARPTLRPGAGGDTKAAALCQARRRADASIGPYAGDGPPRSAPRCGDMLP